MRREREQEDLGVERRPVAQAPPPHPLLAFQRMAGNRATTALVQRFKGKSGETTVHDLASKSLEELDGMLRDVRSKKLKSDPQELWDLHMAIVVTARQRLSDHPDKQDEALSRSAEVLERLNAVLIADDTQELSKTDLAELRTAIKPVLDLVPKTKPGSIFDMAGTGVGRVDAASARQVDPLPLNAGWSSVESTIRSYRDTDTDDRDGNPIRRTDWVIGDYYVSRWDRPPTNQNADGLGGTWGFSTEHTIPNAGWVVHVHRTESGDYLSANVQDAATTGMGAQQQKLTPAQLNRIGISPSVPPTQHVRNRWRHFGRPGT